MRLLDPSATFRGEVDGVPFVARYVSAMDALTALDTDAGDPIQRHRKIAAMLEQWIVTIDDKPATADALLAALTWHGVVTLFNRVLFAESPGKSNTP